MFLKCQTQWRVGMSGIIGLDYTSVIEMIKLYTDRRSTAYARKHTSYRSINIKAIHKENK